jgi:hypothetical protein
VPALYITKAQPNPRGRDLGLTSQLNEEWIEFRAEQSRSLSGDVLRHNTYDSSCRLLSSEALYTFGAISLNPGQCVRVHTGSGTSGWSGSTYHVYMGYGWYKWNNACGDVIALAYNNVVIDSAAYRANPPEGELVRQVGSNLLVPASAGYAWR